MYIYIYIHTYTYVRTYDTCMHAYIQTDRQTYIHPSIHTWIHAISKVISNAGLCGCRYDVSNAIARSHSPFFSYKSVNLIDARLCEVRTISSFPWMGACFCSPCSCVWLSKPAKPAQAFEVTVSLHVATCSPSCDYCDVGDTDLCLVAGVFRRVEHFSETARLLIMNISMTPDVLPICLAQECIFLRFVRTASAALWYRLLGLSNDECKQLPHCQTSGDPGWTRLSWTPMAPYAPCFSLPVYSDRIASKER
jgi:hypothetical protein